MAFDGPFIVRRQTTDYSAPMPSAPRRAARMLSAADALANRIYGSRFNPLYQSGTIAAVLLLVLLATGLWLLLFYRIGSPWDSVAEITAAPLMGNWVRGVHRYASDAALVATLAHALRIVIQRRAWGPRALAWVTGIVLLGLLLVCGVTGFVLVWDSFGRALAVEGARILDALPILSEPVSRAFLGERPVPGVFFFLTLFAHVALPLGMGLALWLHVSRLARPVLLPPRRLTWGVVALLVAVSIAVPLGMDAEGSAFSIPGEMTFDWFYGWWLPLTARLPAGAVWLAGLLAAVPLLLVPRWSRPAPGERPKSVVDEEICVGCRQCGWDCPYDAITMLARSDGRADVVARVDPDRCVSCGICAGSCPPMGVGPPGRTGRNQLELLREFLAEPSRHPGEMVAIACRHGAGSLGPVLEREGATLYPVDCAGNLHTSVIELLVRSGVGGVLVLACRPRDCRNREGPRWLSARVNDGREAELQPRVDRRRVALATAGMGEPHAAAAAVRALRATVRELDQPSREARPEPDLICEPAPPLPKEASR